MYKERFTARIVIVIYNYATMVMVTNIPEQETKWGFHFWRNRISARARMRSLVF